MRKVALVTGGTRGIGLGVSHCLAEAGYDLAVNGLRKDSDVRDTLQELSALGARICYCPGDIGESDARQRLLATVRESFGRLDVLVNNAGMAPEQRTDILEASEESFDRLLTVNLKGPYFLTQAVANWMIEQRKNEQGFSGCIINVSSISATTASPDRGEYCISKAGISMATKLWAVRLAQYDIPVYEIRPGIIQTDMTSAVRDKYDRLIAGGLTLQARWGTPQDVGKAVALLASGQLAYSTGQVLMVDGGLTIPRL